MPVACYSEPLSPFQYLEKEDATLCSPSAVHCPSPGRDRENIPLVRITAAILPIPVDADFIGGGHAHQAASLRFVQHPGRDCYTFSISNSFPLWCSLPRVLTGRTRALKEPSTPGKALQWTVFSPESGRERGKYPPLPPLREKSTLLPAQAWQVPIRHEVLHLEPHVKGRTLTPPPRHTHSRTGGVRPVEWRGGNLVCGARPEPGWTNPPHPRETHRIRPAPWEGYTGSPPGPPGTGSSPIGRRAVPCGCGE